MHAFARGQTDAFDRLYDRYRAPLLRFYRRQTGSAETAEELLQEAFMRLIRTRDSFPHDTPFRLYFWRLARNLLIDHYRRQHRSLPASYGDFHPEQVAADERVQPDREACCGQQVNRLLQLISELPTAQREAFLLREETGMGLEEIAQLTDSSRETVKSRLRYAVGKLRQGMEEFTRE
nr:sigma-70 family RNA polymerase sigma factor [Motiliproteus sediminis]